MDMSNPVLQVAFAVEVAGLILLVLGMFVLLWSERKPCSDQVLAVASWGAEGGMGMALIAFLIGMFTLMFG